MSTCPIDLQPTCPPFPFLNWMDHDGGDADPAWVMVDDEFTPAREHEFESLFAVSNGYLGCRGSLPFGTAMSAPTVFLAGVFDVVPPSMQPELATVPGWTLLSQDIGPQRLAMKELEVSGHRRLLDMRQGLFRREFRFGSRGGPMLRISFLRLASLTERHALLQSSLCVSETYSGPMEIRSGFLLAPGMTEHAFAPAVSCRETPFGPVLVFEHQTQTGIAIALALANRFYGADGTPDPCIGRCAGRIDETLKIEVEAGKPYRNDWLHVCYTSRDTQRPADAALARVCRLLADGTPKLTQRHVDAWRAHWRTTDVEIDGDLEAQRALRFASYHLMSAANPDDERVSIGARALTGPGYKGHVFWDTEIFLLPFYILTDPPAARALLMYRYHTLAASRENAHRRGYAGALYAWESADSGQDVTPSHAIAPTGEVLPVLTGEQAHHISADVAYATWQYWQVTGDDAFLCEAGGEILLETARFWASRGRFESDGCYHIRQVIGPDEYHYSVDDNAYTNWMAQWNLERAVAAARILAERFPQHWCALAERIRLAEDEIRAWQSIAGAMYLGINAEHGVIEQFAGYLALDDIDFAQYAPRSLPIDVLLGRQRTQRSKAIKQADAVMLLHLSGARIPFELAQTSFRYYEPRTAHGSSLSPAIHALVAARLGDIDLALRYFRQAREIDLADNMGNASAGVHIAALGGLWQAAVFGFAGLSLNDDGLGFVPHCPAAWGAIRFALLWRRQRVEVHVEAARLEVRVADGIPLQMTVGAAHAICLDGGWRSRWELCDGLWKETLRERG